jgi:glutaredoxin
MMAKELAEENKLEFEFKNVDNSQYIAEFKEKFPDARTIPQIEWDNEYIGGYDELRSKINIMN